MRNEVVWAIRDARGLTADEKAVLWAVETRGTAFGVAETLAGDAGVSRATFFRRRDELVTRGLLSARKVYGQRQLTYSVVSDSVRELVPSKVSG